ncbi:MAG: HD domain-containing phosphohydrolase [Thermodesulfobacteriota bacterium]
MLETTAYLHVSTRKPWENMAQSLNSLKGDWIMTGEKAKILIVDDEPAICTILARWLSADGYVCKSVHSGEAALDVLEQDEFHLVISDILMPGMSGIDLLSIVRSRFPGVGVLMVTAVDDRKTGIRTLELGAYGYIIKPFDRNEILINVAMALERRDVSMLSDEYGGNLRGHINRSLKQIRQLQAVIFHAISSSGHRHGESDGHLKRVGRFASTLLNVLRPGRSIQELDDMARAAAMHDIGKLVVPEAIWLKDGKLDDRERAVAQTHAEAGAKMLQGADAPALRLAQDIAWAHHEWWDGTGYPRALAGDAIPEAARIVAIVDTYDALLHERPYRPAFPEDEALQIIKNEKDNHFEPRLVDCFMEVLPRLREIRQELRLEASKRERLTLDFSKIPKDR